MKNYLNIQKKFMEKPSVIWSPLLKILKSVGWINSHKDLVKGMKIKVSLGSGESIHGDLSEFEENNIIEIKLKRKNVGVQTNTFYIQETKRGCAVNFQTKLELEKNINKSQVKTNLKITFNSFKLNVKNMDNLIRDELESLGLKPYF